MRCQKCGASLPESANFCGVCGQRTPEPVAERPVYDRAPMQQESTYPGIGGHPAPPVVQPGIVSGSISEGWRTFTAHAGLFIGMFVALVVITLLLSGLSKGVSLVLGIESLESLFEGGASIEGSGAMVSVILWEVVASTLLGIVSTVLGLGAQMAAVRAMRGSQPEFRDLFSVLPMFVTVLVAYILYALMVLGGVILFIIPGIIFAIGFVQYSLLVADKRLPAVASLKLSWAIMRGYKGWYFLLGFVLLGINLLGLLALVIGLIVTVPLSYVIQAAFYRQVLDIYERSNGPVSA